ncbi:unnamed protein product [Pipistrellus nathusii]|uniref:Uncharacterized protein n=1 Tax=Pipistrellus nathusii TaxID=59473 RepID=A0ABN9ZHQ6_PIPNA
MAFSRAHGCRKGKQEAERAREARLSASGPTTRPGRQSQGFLDTALQPGPPACSLGQWARARGGALRLFCPFVGDEFCIRISILSLHIVTIIYSFLSVSVPRSPGAALAFLPRRPSACVLVGTPYA